MAEQKQIFKGFRIVSQDVFSGATDKGGFLWFVKRADEDGGYGDIYFGDKHYGHNGNEADLINNLSGAVQTIIGSGFSESSITEVVAAVKSTLDSKADSSALNDYVLMSALTADYATSAATVAAVSAMTITVEKQGTAESGWAATYVIKQGGTKVGESINIPKDQFLQDAIFCAASSDVPSGITVPQGQEFPAICFTFQTLTEDEHVVFVEVKDLVDTYTAGEGISMSGTAISVEIAASGATKNFLSLESDGLAVREIEADVTKTSTDIAIDGGAWAEDVKAAYGNTLPAGTTLQDFFDKMLRQEKWNASSINTETAFTVGLANGFNVSANYSNNAVVEVGTKVTVNALQAKDTTTHSQSYKVSKFDYGYKVGKDGDYSPSTEQNNTLTPTLLTSGNTLKEVFSNFADFSGNSIATVVDNANSLPSIDVYALEGNCVVNAYQSGDTYSSQSAASKVYYIATSFHNFYKKDNKKEDNTYTASPTFKASDTAKGNASLTVVGKFYYYYGFDTLGLGKSGADLTDNAIKAMPKNWITKDGTTTLVANDPAKPKTAEGNIVVAVPSKYKLASIIDKLTGQSVLGNFERTTRQLAIGGGKTTEYAVYYWSAASAPTYYNLTITKA